jgi:hypothetical protein
MKFNWSVNAVTVAENNLITQVDCTVTAVDGDKTASAAYTRNLVRGDSFIPYDQLTEAQVLAWCFEPEVTPTIDLVGNVGSSTRFIKDDGEIQVAGQIARQLAQKTAQPALPWVTA